MKPGDMVKVKDPYDENEANGRYEVVELRGERVLLRDLRSPYPIKPTFVYLVSDLVVCDA